MLVAALLAAVAAPCPIDHAIYRQRDSAIVARFRAIDAGPDWPARLAMRLSFGNARPAQWWLVWHGGSAGGQFLASTGDVDAAGWHPPSPDDAAERPRGDVALIAAEADYGIRGAPLTSGDGAPAHLLVPELRRLAWYGPDDTPRAAESGQFFDLVRCDAPAATGGE